MSEPEAASSVQRLEPDVLERLRGLNVINALFAFHETNDEWTLEDVSLTFADGAQLEDGYGDELEPGLRDALEDATWQRGFYTCVIQ